MKDKIHDLKTWPVVFDAMAHGGKTAEFRRNDRGFKVGHFLNLREWSPDTNEYTGNCLLARINHIVEGGQFGIPEGYCVMSVTVDSDNLFSPPAKEAGEIELRGKILAYGISFANRYFNQLNISDSNEAKKEFIDSILALLTPYIDQLAKERERQISRRESRIYPSNPEVRKEIKKKHIRYCPQCRRNTSHFVEETASIKAEVCRWCGIENKVTHKIASDKQEAKPL